jgi:pyrophosphate--fructose-6-phosphate 1-phosphotransferase
VRSALDGVSGLVGQDEDQGNVIRACEFERVAGAKPFNAEQAWFDDLLSDLGQPRGKLLSH